MKILVVMKRFGTNKDMVMEDFGRQIRLFENLSKEHEIDFLCMDYKKKENKDVKRNNMNFSKNIHWIEISFFNLSFLIVSYYRIIWKYTKNFF